MTYWIGALESTPEQATVRSVNTEVLIQNACKIAPGLVRIHFGMRWLSEADEIGRWVSETESRRTSLNFSRQL